MSDDCSHEHFLAEVTVSRLFGRDDEVAAAVQGVGIAADSLAIDVRAWCAVCQKPVRFEGPIGSAIGPGAPPMVSLDGTELRAAGHMGENRSPSIRMTMRVEPT